MDGVNSYANPPNSWLFHEFMQDIMDFGLISWEGSPSKSCLKNSVKNIVKTIVISWKF